MKTLHLNLKRKWFEMILEGIKTEEYRDIKEHWSSQLLEKSIHPSIKGKYRFESIRTIFNILTGYYGSRSKAVLCGIDMGYFHYKDYDTITFSNGYAADRPQFKIELKGIEIREGNPEWGADPGKKYFVLKLGKIINDINCTEIILS